MFVAFMTPGCVECNPVWIYLVASVRTVIKLCKNFLHNHITNACPELKTSGVFIAPFNDVNLKFSAQATVLFYAGVNNLIRRALRRQGSQEIIARLFSV